MEYFNLKTQNIFTKFKFLGDRLDKSPHPKNYLIELTKELSNKILKNMIANQIMSYIKIDEIYFFFHPWLINFFGSTTELIEALCNLKNRYPHLFIEFALDPYKSSSKIPSSHMVLERISGIYYNIEKIITKLNQRGKSLISVFFDPELLNSENIKDPIKKIKALERHLNAVGGGRWPIRIIINFADNKHDEIHFNIYEYSNLKKDSFYICRSLHGIYKISDKCYIHIDGKILRFEVEDYKPYQLVFQKNLKKPSCKLFRVDGKLPEKLFVFLFTLFFYNNDIVLEFFEIENLEEFLLENNECKL